MRHQTYRRARCFPAPISYVVSTTGPGSCVPGSCLVTTQPSKPLKSYGTDSQTVVVR